MTDSVHHLRHPRTEELLAFADGELPEVFVDNLEAHLVGCSECRELIADYRELPGLNSSWPTADEKRRDLARFMDRIRHLTPPPLAEFAPREFRSMYGALDRRPDGSWWQSVASHGAASEGIIAD